MNALRHPAVAGMFYPDDAIVLARMVQGLLAAVEPASLRPKALIAPHAGYIYSGATAAQAYALLQPLRDIVKRVVLLGPVHRVWTAGLALPDALAFATPLGRIEVDLDAIARLAKLPQVQNHAAAHAQEHSLEVHLPFLQSVLAEFTLVPLAVGGAGPEQVADVLDRLWGGEETLIVVSSDLSHFLPYAQAQQMDRATVVSEMQASFAHVKKAMADAKKKAEQLAALAGVTLGKPTYVAEGAQSSVVYDSYRSAGMTVPAPTIVNAVPPISTGETKITLNVQVSYGVTQ